MTSHKPSKCEGLGKVLIHTPLHLCNIHQNEMTSHKPSKCEGLGKVLIHTPLHLCNIHPTSVERLIDDSFVCVCVCVCYKRSSKKQGMKSIGPVGRFVVVVGPETSTKFF